MMENRIITAVFKGSKNTKVSDVWQWDYGQTLRIQGLDLPTAVEVDFAVAGASESIARIGTTKDGVTDVVIPDSLIETGKNLVAYIYLRDSASGNTEYQIDMLVTKRAKPEAYDRPEDKKLFGQAIEAVNTAADRAEKAGQTATEAAGQAAEDAQQTAEDRKEVEKMVETVSDISEQVKKVEELSNKVQEAATKTGQDAQQTAEDRAEVGKMLETVRDVSEQVKSVEESVRKAKESEQAAAGHRTAVEEMKNSVEQTASTFPQTVQEGVQAIENAGTAEVQEITQAGTAQKTAVEAAGTQAVENVKNVKQTATEAVETAKTEAVQAVQAEGVKQIKEVQDKGAEVLQSIPEDFATQMETKLNKQQGIENKGKVLVIGEDGNVVPGEVASGGGDGIAIINTMSGESPLVIPDSAERVNKRLELGGKTDQVQTTGANLFDEKLLLDFDSENYDKTQSGSRFYYYKFPVNGTVTASTKNANKNGEYLTVGIKPDGSDKTWLSHGSAAISKYKTLTPEDGNIYLGVNNSLERVKSMIQNTGGIIINEGSAAKPYEPYTGGKPSPSPEYPQEIKNSGKWNEGTQKYEVGVKVTGKNLFDIEKAEVSGGNLCTAKRENNIVKITAIETVTSKRAYAIVSGGGIYLKSGKTYFLNGRKVGTSNMTPMFAFFKEKNNGELLKMGNFYTPNEDICIDIGIYLVGDAIRTGNTLEITDIIVCEGKDAAQYQPYTEQTITITSDRPITKWDKLVEQGGQIGWLYNSVNETIDGKTGKWSIQPASKIFYRTDITFPIAVPFCSELLGYDYSSVGYKKDTGITINNLGILCITLPEEVELTPDAYKQYLADNPLHVLYKGDSEEFVPLPEEEQNAIRALKTYYPTTVITVDGGELDPDIKVTYTADTKNYIDGKVSAKVASILRQYQADTANLLSLMPMETQATMIENDTNNILNNLESEEAHE
jgi:hypothetical protein